MPPSTPRAAFQAAARQALSQIEVRARAVLSADDPEDLHQLRVAMRRLRAALRAFKPILPAKKAKRLRGTLRALSPTLGAARDWDVLVQRLNARPAPRLAARAEKKRANARRKALDAIASRKFARLLAHASALEARDTGATLRELGAASLERAHRRLMKEARGANWRDAAARHAVRIRVKRLRYSCEFFAPAFPGEGCESAVAALKALQEILGELNDIAVGRRLIGYDADEALLLERLEDAWARFVRLPGFWSAPARTLRRAARRTPRADRRARARAGSRPPRTPAARHR